MKGSKTNWLIPLGIVLTAAVLLMAAMLLRPKAEQNEVVITVAGQEYARIPLSQPQTVTVRQENGEENVIEITERGAHMERSTCKNQQCVHMGEVTLDNWETRPNQEFIICLPNQVVIELIVRVEAPT